MKFVYIFIKDCQSEIRTRYAVNSLAMFILVAISVILFSIGTEPISEYLAGGLFWIAAFFSAMSGLSRVFVSEEDKNCSMTLRLLAEPDSIFTGKLLFNLTLIFLINIFILALHSILFESFAIKNYSLFFLAFIFGNIGLAVSSTIIAAIIAKAGNRGTLYPVLSFPILLPVILILLELTKFSMDGLSIIEASAELFILISYDIVMLTASHLLFGFIWKE